MADQIEEVEVVKKTCTPFIDRAEEQVAEMTYARAFELYGNPLPDIIDPSELRKSCPQFLVMVLP